MTKVSAVPEGLVEPPVEERVVAGGGHGEGVAGEEGHVVPLPAVHAVGEIRDISRLCVKNQLKSPKSPY